jgi:hypothetical protein
MAANFFLFQPRVTQFGPRMGERDSLFLFLQWRREESASLFYSWQLSNEILKAMQKVKAGVVCVFHPPWDICQCAVFATDETMTMQYFFIALS